jgi:Domain of unknown function (DUF4397)
VSRILRLMSLCAGILGVGAILLISGCGGGGQTRLRVMNAVPDESSIDLLVDSVSVSTNIAYGTSTGYQTTKSGSHQVAIEPSGSTTPLLTQSISFSSDSDTTVISYNFSSNIANLVLTDDNSAPASGNFKIRIVNASPGLGPADVYIVAPLTDLNTVSPTITNLAFGSSTGYQGIAAGSYDVVLTPVGQKFSAVDTGSLTFISGQVRTFVGLNSQSGGFSYTMLQDLN